MRKIFMLSLAALLGFVWQGYSQEAVTAPAPQEGSSQRFYIYKDKDSSLNHFIPSGWMGDVNDLKVNGQSTDQVKDGTTSMEVTYSAKKTAGQGWVGVYWQSAQNNWGTMQTGFDLSDFNKLVFSAKGKKGGEVITTVKVGGINQGANGAALPFPDTASAEEGPIRVTADWQEYSVNLAGKDLSYVNGGLALIFNADQAGAEQTIYIDEVYFVKDESLQASTGGVNLPFYVYADATSLDNHFIPSGWMPGTAARDIKINPNWKENAYSGDSCIRIEYKNVSGTRWAGTYWQNPAGNWGTVPSGGFNLQGATKLTFWAKGETGNEMITEFKMGGMASGEHPDSDSASSMPVQLTKEWKKYEIDLRGKDLSHIIGGFCWSTNIDTNNPEGVVFYLDEIKYEKE